MAETAEWVPGPRKAAILLATLGAEASASVLKHCTEKEIERVTAELLALGDLRSMDHEVQNKILDEAMRLSMVEGGLPSSAFDYAWEILAEVLGEAGANELLKRLRSGESGGIPFSFMQNTEPAQLVKFMSDEHPQTIALILSYLSPERAADILSELSPDLQREIAERIVMMEQASPDVVREVEYGLAEKLSPMLADAKYESARGLDSLVAVLKSVSRSTEKTILEHLAETNPHLAEKIRQKMFVFEDLVLLDDRAIQKVLREVDKKDLTLALRGAPPKIRDLIFRNLSSRAREMLEDEIEAMGPQRLSDIEQAQQAIVNTVRDLEEAEEIVIAQQGGGEVVV
jgi:flagellar motor switch protein FliG